MLALYILRELIGLIWNYSSLKLRLAECPLLVISMLLQTQELKKKLVSLRLRTVSSRMEISFSQNFSYHAYLHYFCNTKGLGRRWRRHPNLETARTSQTQRSRSRKMLLRFRTIYLCIYLSAFQYSIRGLLAWKKRKAPQRYNER